MFSKYEEIELSLIEGDLFFGIGALCNGGPLIQKVTGPTMPCWGMS